MITAKAVMDSLPEDAAAGPAAVLSWFRRDFHACLTARRDEIFELADAVLCADGPVRDLAGLSLAPEHRRTVRDYERLPASHEAMILWAMIALMTSRLAATTQ